MDFNECWRVIECVNVSVIRKYTNSKSVNSWAHFDIANPQISELCQSKIENIHDYSANRKSANFFKIQNVSKHS